MQSPRDLGLPYDTWRPGQRLAIRTILHAKTPHVVINAPTGSGKSTIAAALPKLNEAKRHVILTATKALQNQYSGTFPYLTDLKGASNYSCRAAVDEFKDWFPIQRRKSIGCDDGPCHLGHPCGLRDVGCDYFDAKRQFISSSAGSTNYAAWLSNRRVGAGLGSADRLVCDEAHRLPEELMSAAGVSIPFYLLDSHRVPAGYKEWQRWATEKLDHLASSDQKHTTKREQLTRDLKLMALMDHTWAWDKDEWKKEYRFEPTIPRLLMSSLQTFDNKESVVYMSATITPSMLELLGITANDVTFHTMSSSFPLSSRPIYFVPGAKGNYRAMMREGNWELGIDTIDDIIEDRTDRRGVIHCVSFDRGERIYHSSDHRGLMILHRRGERAEDVVARWQQFPPGAVLISPSVMTGFDFKYDMCRYQILPKLPFPNTASSIMRARVKGTPRYKDNVTMQNFVQACGRPVREDDDWAETFVTDGDIAWWYDKNKDLAPDYFDEAIVRTRRRVIPPDLATGPR